MSSLHRKGIISVFAQHPVAANLLMMIMIVVGVYSVMNLRTQFFPSFNVDKALVSVIWQGASAEDVEDAITSPLEKELRTLNNLKKITSTSSDSRASITIDFIEGTDIGMAVDEVKEKVATVRNLPETAEEPEVRRAQFFDTIAQVVLTGEVSIEELSYLANQMQSEMLDRGIGKVDIRGLPEQEISIEVPTETLKELQLSLDQLAARVIAQSRDIPAGKVGNDDVARQIRTLDQRRTVPGFEQIPLLADDRGQFVRLGDVATVKRQARDNETSLTFDGQPALILHARRVESSDALEGAKILNQWIEDVRPSLPKGVSLHVFDERWTYISDRLSVLLKNGAQGLVLVIVILFLFLNGRVAFWVTAGIPASFLAALAALWMNGGSINMISMFGLIMALGVIVDDAIVVGENALSNYEEGKGALEAAESGATRMLGPVIASSLTTICSFAPLMMIGGIMGSVIGDIPVVVICVILASLVECFFVLPGHLRSSFAAAHHLKPSGLRQKLDKAFNHFRDHYFRPFVTYAVSHRSVVLAAAFGMLIFSTWGLLGGGRVPFNFFPSPDGGTLFANVQFVAGTPESRVKSFLQNVDEALYETEQALGGNIVKLSMQQSNATAFDERNAPRQGKQFGALLVELVSPDKRDVTNAQFIREWRSRVERVPGLETFVIKSPDGGPPGREIDIKIVGSDLRVLKKAAEEAALMVGRYPGVQGIEDDMPYGQQQLIFSVSPQGQALGLSPDSIGRQLRSAFDGYLVQIFQLGPDEIEVWMRLPAEQRHSMSTLERFAVRLPNGESAPLSSVVTFRDARGFEIIRHDGAQRAVHVTADVDPSVGNAANIRTTMQQKELRELEGRYGVKTALEGRAEEMAETVGDMKRGFVVALVLIYIVLAWVFGSYSAPVIVMMAIPFGLIGAIVGHYVMGIEMSILSWFGIFGLTGIVINDSIILVSFYKELRGTGLSVNEALIESACQRLRAVILTSLTTIGGLIFLVFETSMQAQFLIPMAVAISFGLLFATVLVLAVIPAMMSLMEQVIAWHHQTWLPNVEKRIFKEKSEVN